jgi:hypothetical protein
MVVMTKRHISQTYEVKDGRNKLEYVSPERAAVTSRLNQHFSLLMCLTLIIDLLPTIKRYIQRAIVHYSMCL